MYFSFSFYFSLFSFGAGAFSYLFRFSVSHFLHNFGPLRDSFRSAIYPFRLEFLGQTEPRRVSIFVFALVTVSRQKTSFLKKEEFKR